MYIYYRECWAEKADEEGEKTDHKNIPHISVQDPPSPLTRQASLSAPTQPLKREF